MLPGMGSLANVDLQVAEKEMKKVEAIIYSMTLEERS